MIQPTLSLQSGLFKTQATKYRLLKTLQWFLLRLDSNPVQTLFWRARPIVTWPSHLIPHPHAHWVLSMLAFLLVFCLLNPPVFLVWLIAPSAWHPRPLLNMPVWAVTLKLAHRCLSGPPNQRQRATSTAGWSNSLHILSASATFCVYLSVYCLTTSPRM